MPDNFQKVFDAFNLSEKTGEAVDIGEIVLCDLCSKDYTDDHTSAGGFLFGTKGVGPCCAATFRRSIEEYGETEFIKAEAAEGQTFRDFILALRGGNNNVRVRQF